MAKEALRFLTPAQVIQAGLEADAVPVVAWRMNEMITSSQGHLRSIKNDDEAHLAMPPLFHIG